jgi:catechol 2,3-dioxygenase-like lactoylglutathione lyase family enzyme
MKRFHVHVSVKDLPRSIGFYSKLFGAPPTVEKPDYAKWMLEDPRVNFAISQRGRAAGVNHLGFQVDSEAELAALRGNVAKADIAALDEAGAACCYARSDKYWIEDPQGIAWETFHTLGGIPVYGENAQRADDSACCVPLARQAGDTADAACCVPGPGHEARSACGCAHG